MFADPASFGLATSTSGALGLPFRKVLRGSRGSAQIIWSSDEDAESPIQTASPSIGGWVTNYGLRLIQTASAHTILAQVAVPIPILLEPDLTDLGDPIVEPISNALAELQGLSGLPKVRIAEDLLGVTRQAYFAWERGGPVTIEHEHRIRSVLDVMRRASIRYSRPELLRGWLFTPVGSHASVPIDLLREGRIDEARLLAVSVLPERKSALPDWLTASPVNDWSIRHQRRRNSVMRASDAMSRDEILD